MGRSPTWHSRVCIWGDETQGHGCTFPALNRGCSITSRINSCQTWEDTLFLFAANDFINLSGACQ